MTPVHELRPGEARILELRPGTRCLIHRPGRQPIYLVYEEDQRRQSVEPLGSFSTWAAALGAAQARASVPAA
ncbi:MAG: hypothetical protein HY690_11120 [Chloroflexi bacterium]|nr:hypothetical protein [Chloroflexota bacterium]